MQRRAPADRAHHLHAAALGDRTFDVDDFVALSDRQVDRLSGGAVQFAHRPERCVAHVEPGLHQIAEFQQPHAELVGARFGTIDEPGGHQIVQDAVRGRRVQPGAARQILQADRIGLVGECIEQRHQPLDDLDRGLAVVGRRCAGSGHGGYCRSDGMDSVYRDMKQRLAKRCPPYAHQGPAIGKPVVGPDRQRAQRRPSARSARPTIAAASTPKCARSSPRVSLRPKPSVPSVA